MVENKLQMLESLSLEEVRTMMDKVDRIISVTKSERLFSVLQMVECHLADMQDELGYDDSHDAYSFYSGGTDYAASDAEIENFFYGHKYNDDPEDYQGQKPKFQPYQQKSLYRLTKELMAHTKECEHYVSYGTIEMSNHFTNDFLFRCGKCYGRLKK